jgi:hypothetical protein
MRKLGFSFLLVPCLIAVAPTGGFANTQAANTRSSSKNTSSPNIVTAMNINNHTARFVGKQVSLSGNVDRVLSPGAMIINDRGAVRGAEHKILVLTPGAATAPDSMGNQQAGVAGLKEGDLVKLQGKVEKLSVSSKKDTFSPKTEQETVQQTSASMPVIVAQLGTIQKQG